MKEIKKIYLSFFLAGFAMVASFETLYLLSKGLNQYDITLVIGIFMFSLAMFEIPTGAFADTIGHKKSVLVGIIIQTLSFFAMAWSVSYYQFVISYILAALGVAFVSGAYTSLIHDILKNLKKSEEFTKVYGRADGLFFVGSVIAASVAGFIYKFKPELTYIIAGIFISLSGVLVYFIKWDFVGEKPSLRVYLKKMISGVHLTLKNRRLMILTLLLSVLSIYATIFTHNLNQPYLLSIGFDVVAIGVIAAVTSAFAALISAYSYKLRKVLGDFLSLLVIIGTISFSSLLLSQTYSQIGLLFIFILSFGQIFKYPLITTLQQREATHESRSTMISTTNFITRIMISIALPFWGGVINTQGINLGFWYLGVVTFVISMCLLLFYRRSQRAFST